MIGAGLHPCPEAGVFASHQPVVAQHGIPSHPLGPAGPTWLERVFATTGRIKGRAGRSMRSTEVNQKPERAAGQTESSSPRLLE